MNYYFLIECRKPEMVNLKMCSYDPSTIWFAHTNLNWFLLVRVQQIIINGLVTSFRKGKLGKAHLHCLQN